MQSWPGKITHTHNSRVPAGNRDRRYRAHCCCWRPWQVRTTHFSCRGSQPELDSRRRPPRACATGCGLRVIFSAIHVVGIVPGPDSCGLGLVSCAAAAQVSAVARCSEVWSPTWGKPATLRFKKTTRCYILIVSRRNGRYVSTWNRGRECRCIARRAVNCFSPVCRPAVALDCSTAWSSPPRRRTPLRQGECSRQSSIASAVSATVLTTRNFLSA
jgi:hypothetical protein